MKVSDMFELDFFLDSMKKVLSKFPQKIYLMGIWKAFTGAL